MMVLFNRQALLKTDNAYISISANTTGTPVASIGDKNYDTLQAAVDAAKPEDTIELINNITLSTPVTIGQGEVININGKDKTIKLTTAAFSDPAAGGAVEGLKGNTQLSITNVNFEGTTANNKHALNVYNAKNVVIENMVLDHETAKTGAPLIIASSDVTVEGTLKTITGANSWYAVNVDSRGTLPGVGSKLTVDNAAILIFEGDKATGILIENSGNIGKDNVGVSFGENVEVISTIADFVPVAKAENAAVTVENPENAGIIANADGSFQMTYPVSIVINYVTKDGKVLATEEYAEKAPAGDFTWKYEDNYWLKKMPKGYEVADWDGLTKEVKATVSNDGDNVSVYDIVVKAAAEGAATSDKTPKTGDPFSLALILGLMGAAGAGTGVALKRKNR